MSLLDQYKRTPLTLPPALVISTGVHVLGLVLIFAFGAFVIVREIPPEPPPAKVVEIKLKQVEIRLNDPAPVEFNEPVDKLTAPVKDGFKRALAPMEPSPTPSTQTAAVVRVPDQKPKAVLQNQNAQQAALHAPADIKDENAHQESKAVEIKTKPAAESEGISKTLQEEPRAPVATIASASSSTPEAIRSGMRQNFSSKPFDEARAAAPRAAPAINEDQPSPSISVAGGIPEASGRPSDIKPENTLSTRSMSAGDMTANANAGRDAESAERIARLGNSGQITKPFSAEEIESQRGGYIEAIRGKIQAAKFYPQKARDREFEGKPTVHFSLDKNGKLLTLDLERPCTYEILNSAALQTVKNAEPFPPFPSSLQTDSMTFSLPIVYTLR